METRLTWERGHNQCWAKTLGLVALCEAQRTIGWRWSIHTEGRGIALGHSDVPCADEVAARAAAEDALQTFLLAALKKLGIDVEAMKTQIEVLETERDEAREQAASVEVLLNLKYQSSSCKVLLGDMTPEDKQWRIEAKAFYARAKAYLAECVERSEAPLRDRIAALESALVGIDAAARSNFFADEAARVTDDISFTAQKALRGSTSALDAALQEARTDERKKIADNLRRMTRTVLSFQSLANAIEDNTLMEE